MIRPLLAGFVLAATMGSAGAEPGSASCAVWLKERTTAGAADLRTWALGVVEQYASRLPEHTSPSFADNENILSRVDIYCEAHLSDNVGHAVQSVIDDFEELREALEDLRKGG